MGRIKEHYHAMITQEDLNTWIEEGHGPQPTANDIQHGGNHYKKYGDMQPWDVIVAWNLGYLEGTALKYIARWRDKNGVEDLNKAIHFLQKAVEVHGTK